MDLVIYVHGKGGSAAEAEHFRSLFPAGKVIGLDYKTSTPWETGSEIRAALEGLQTEAEAITLIANSIGAFFCMNADIQRLIRRAYFISPIVDMEKLIRDTMARAGVNETELKQRGVIPTTFGEDLSWEYLCYVRRHPIRWDVPTEILYGGGDELTARETIADFAQAHGAGLTVMEDGGHWFHTPEQMRFLDQWITEKEKKSGAQTI